MSLDMSVRHLTETCVVRYIKAWLSGSNVDVVDHRSQQSISLLCTCVNRLSDQIAVAMQIMFKDVRLHRTIWMSLYHCATY